MRRFTLATLAILVSAGSILTLSPSVKAESREEYCRYHRCGSYHNRDYNYNYNRGYRNNYDARRYNNRQRYRWYDSRTRTWHYGYR